MVTVEQIDYAKSLARASAQKFFYERLGGVDQYACGFAWVNVYVDRTNSKQARELIAAGFRKDYVPKRLTMWNPSELPVQNVDTLEAGASAMAEHLSSLGLKAFAGSRLD
jgi:hypothetical protein